MNAKLQSIFISSNEAANAIDTAKLLIILKKSGIWVFLIMILCISSAFLYIRYTKPIFESYSELKLEQEDQSNILGLSNISENNYLADLSGEIELIKSRLFFNKVINVVNLNPQYFTYGNILDDEKYINSPFKVKYTIKDNRVYDQKFDLSIINNTEYRLSYFLEGKEYNNAFEFGEKVSNKYFEFKISIVDNDVVNSGELEYYFLINSHESLVNYLESSLSVEPLNLNAQTFKISFQDHNLKKAHDLVAAIDTLYYEYSINEKNKTNNNKIDYLDNQLRDTELQLDKFENYFEDFTITNKTVNLDEDVKYTIELINGLDTQRLSVKNKLAELELLSKRISEKDSDNLSANRYSLPVNLVHLIDEYNIKLNAQKALSLSYSDKTHTYQSKEKELELLKVDILVEINELKTNLHKKVSEFARQKVTLSDKLMRLPSKSTELNKAKRFYKLYEQLYISLMQSKTEFEIAIAGSTTQIKILSPASMPKTSIYPNNILAYVAGVGLGIFLSFLFVIIRYLLHKNITSLQELEHLTQRSVLGTIPIFKTKDVTGKLLIQKMPKSAVSESLRSIRTNLEFIIPEKGPKVFSFTSTISAEGKTFISTNLAGLLAMTGKRVVILDLDLRKPKVHTTFGDAVSETGISTILINKHNYHECIRATDIQSLFYIPAGAIPPNPSELLVRKEFDDLLENLKLEFDIIIMDTPPVGIVTDGLLAMQKADLSMYILRANYSKRAFVHNVNRLIEGGNFPNLSIILNALNDGKSGYGYAENSHYYEE